MSLLKNFYLKTLTYDFINKFIYNNSNNLPKLQKIILNFGFRAVNLKKLSSSLLVFELIANKKGFLTQAKKLNILFKASRSNLAWSKVVLHKSFLFSFFEKIVMEISSKLKNLNEFNFTKKTKKNSFSYKFYDIFSFKELKNYYYHFNNLPKLNVIIVTNCKKQIEFIFVFKSFKFF